MKITNKQVIPGVLVAAAIVSGATYLTISNLNTPVAQVAYAYTSAANPVDPATAPNSYVVNIPDANLKKALNAILTQLNPFLPARADDAPITAGDLKSPVTLNLDAKSITNLEGAQFLVNAHTISLASNQITNVAPLADLAKVKVLTLSRNRITDVTPLAQISSLETLALELNQTLTTVAPLATAPKLKDLNINSTKVSDLTPIASIATLERLHMRNLLISPAKINLAPIASHPKLAFINAHSNRLTGSELSVMKNAPVLATFMTAGNNVLNLQDFLNSGFTTLHQSSTFSAQTHSINTGNNPLIANPVRGINGEVIPVTETATVKNANADGTLNPNGAYIKLVDTYGNGTVNVAWTKNFTYRNVTDRPFSGTIAVRYTLPARDTVAPTFSPASPAKITSRKGVAININDVTATDNTGGSGVNAAGVTNNAAAINLDAANPAAGNYTLTYSVSDNQNNTRTVNRQIEITDADALQTKVDSTTDTMLDNGGYTAESIAEVRAKRQAAQTVIANNGATQAQIDQALSDLNTALGQLTVSTQPIDTVIADEYNAAPDYIKNEAGVAAAFAQANNTKNDPARTKQTVQQAADNLHNAIEAAKNAEAARQTTARDALQTATNDKTPNAFNNAQATIAAVQDPTTKAQLQSQLDALKNAYNTKKAELQNKVDSTNDAFLAGYTAETVNAVKDKKQAAEAVLANPNASQAQIDQALSDLNNAIAALVVDNTPITDQLNTLQTKPTYIQNNSAVQAAKQQAEATAANPARTKEQVQQAATDLANAIRSAEQAEQANQAAAERALQNAEVVKAPDAFVEAQSKINAILDDAVKASQQARLDALIANRNAKKDELEQLLNLANDPATTDGMAQDANLANFRSSLAAANAVFNDANSSQDVIESVITDLTNAINALVTDKQPVTDAIAYEATQPDYIKNNTEVVAALAEATNVSNEANPTTLKVRSAAKNLRDAIDQAIQAEADAQAAVDTSLTQAEAEVANPALGANELPVVDIAAIQAEIDAIQDPTAKADAQARLDAIKQAIETKKSQIAADQRAKAEQKAKEELERRRAAQAKTGIKSPSTGVARQEGLVATIVAGALAILSLPVVLLVKKRK